jgi:hypothetical protein
VLVSIGAACSRHDECAAVAAIEFVCGPSNAEDLVLIPETPWIIAS